MFSKILALSRTNSYGFLAPCQDLDKTNDPVSIKCLDRQPDGGNDGRTDRPYFKGPFRLRTRVQKKDMHDIKCIK